MRTALVGIIKMAMDAQWTDADIAKVLKEAAEAVEKGMWWGWAARNSMK